MSGSNSAEMDEMQKQIIAQLHELKMIVARMDTDEPSEVYLRCKKSNIISAIHMIMKTVCPALSDEIRPQKGKPMPYPLEPEEKK